MKLALALLLVACAGPVLAQDGRFVDPQPVDFDQPFQFDGLRARDGVIVGGSEGPALRAEPVPIEVWLANGRTLKGLESKAHPPPPSMDLDAEALRSLFKDLLPQETPTEKAPSLSR